MVFVNQVEEKWTVNAQRNGHGSARILYMQYFSALKFIK